MNKVVVVTVTYGNRWKFLSQVIDSVISDIYLEKLIIVDNGSVNKKEIDKSVNENKNKIILIRSDKNVGSAGGFALGLEYAREIDCSYVFILDDDNVPEVGAIQKFIDNLKTLNREDVVLCGNRLDLSGNQEFFYKKELIDTEPRGTFFEVFSVNKVKTFLKLLTNRCVNLKNNTSSFKAIVPNESFVYGGTFIPISAVRQAPLPDKDLILYGDDIEYSWGVKRLGYKSYVCASPQIHDIDSSFGESHILGLFSPHTQSFKVYYRIRNMVRISIRNTKQNQIVLFTNVIIWIVGLCILGLFKYGITKNYFERVVLIIQSVYAGYVKTATVPRIAKLP